MDICVYELHHTMPWCKMKQACPASYAHNFNYLILCRQLFFATPELFSIWWIMLSWQQLWKLLPPGLTPQNINTDTRWELFNYHLNNGIHIIACTVKQALYMFFPKYWRLWGAIPSYLGKCSSLVDWYQILE